MVDSSVRCRVSRHLSTPVTATPPFWSTTHHPSLFCAVALSLTRMEDIERLLHSVDPATQRCSTYCGMTEYGTDTCKVSVLQYAPQKQRPELLLQLPKLNNVQQKKFAHSLHFEIRPGQQARWIWKKEMTLTAAGN